MILRARLLLLASTLPFVAGCGAYLHRPELEASTAAIKMSFGALSAPAYLEQQQRQLEEYATREDRAIAEFNVASRDNSLLNIVGSGATSSRVDLLQGQIQDLLWQAVQVRSLPDPNAHSRERFQERLAAARVEIAGDLGRSFQEDYRRRGGTSTRLTCAQLLDGGRRPPADDPEPTRAPYRLMVAACEEAAVAQQRLNVCAFGFTNGNLPQACQDLDRLRGELGRAMTRKSDFDKAIDALKKALDGATAVPPSESTRFRALVARVQTNPTLDDYQEVLEALDTVFGFELGASLNQLSQARDRALAHPAVDSVYNALVAFQALRALTVEERAALDQPSALLIGLAKVRHDLNMVQVEIDRLRRLIALKQGEINALQLQLHYLARAQCALQIGRRSCALDGQPFAEALSHYVSSFDKGLIPAQVLASRALQVDRAATIRTARATEADYRALLQPAIDQLAAYGAGGIRPEILGPFIANLPVTGAILGR